MNFSLSTIFTCYFEILVLASFLIKSKNIVKFIYIFYLLNLTYYKKIVAEHKEIESEFISYLKQESRDFKIPVTLDYL